MQDLKAMRGQVSFWDVMSECGPLIIGMVSVTQFSMLV